MATYEELKAWGDCWLPVAEKVQENNEILNIPLGASISKWVLALVEEKIATLRKEATPEYPITALIRASASGYPEAGLKPGYVVRVKESAPGYDAYSIAYGRGLYFFARELIVNPTLEQIAEEQAKIVSRI